MGTNDEQPTTAHYRRTPEDELPAAPAAQVADIEAMLQRARLAPADDSPLADHNRRALARLLDRAEPSHAGRRWAEQMRMLAEEYERDRRAEIIAAGGDPDSFEHVRAIADEWTDTADDADRRAALLDRLADRLDTSEVRALRLAAEAAVAITPRLIYADADAGVSAAVTAADLGMTPSYVYRVLRERPATD